MKPTRFLNALLLTLAFDGAIASAALIYESAELGPTGIPVLDVGSQMVPGSGVTSGIFVGSRLQIHRPVKVTHIGCHFVGPFSEGNRFFGSLMRLQGKHNLPDFRELSSTDMLAATTMTFPLESEVVWGKLNVELVPGWYALLFGGSDVSGQGLFGATGRGAALRNNIPIDDNVNAPLVSGIGWGLDGGRTHYLAIRGSVVSEPTSFPMLFATSALGSLVIVLAKRQFRPDC